MLMRALILLLSAMPLVLATETRADNLIQVRCLANSDAAGIFSRMMTLHHCESTASDVKSLTGTMTLVGVNLMREVSSVANYSGYIRNAPINFSCLQNGAASSFALVEVSLAVLSKIEIGVGVGKGVCVIDGRENSNNGDIGLELMVGTVHFSAPPAKN